MSGKMTLVVAAFFVMMIKIAKARREKRREKETRRTEEIQKAGQFTCVREIMSCLVEQVYAADGGHRKHASKVWRALGYEECNLRDFGVTEAHIEAAGKPTCKIRFMLFRRRDDVSQETTEEWTSVRPEYVVAIRGTKPRCQQDLVDDIRHACEKLHSSPDYGNLLSMTKTVFDRCASLNGNHFNDKMVCVTGHSLGAAFGLLVGRQLELDGRRVQAHLFNPPFLTLEIIIRKSEAALKHAVEKIVDLQEVQDIFRFLGAIVIEAVVTGGAKVTGATVRGAIVTGAIVKKALTNTPIPDRHQVERVRDQMKQEYPRLGNWTPNLYVNEHDIICNHYIKYFKSNTPQWSSSQTRSLEQGLDVRASHLIPSAVLHTNSRKVHRKPRSFYSCHRNNQWFKHPLEDDSHEEYNLLTYLDEPQ